MASSPIPLVGLCVCLSLSVWGGLSWATGGKDATSSRQPASKQPAVRRPANRRPANRRPASRRPAVRRPAVRRPAVRRPAVRRPAVRRPADRRVVSRYDRFIKKIKQRLVRKPKSARLHTILGRLYQRAGQLSLAGRHYDIALRYKKGYSHALVGKAHLFLRAGKLRRAKRLLGRVLRRHPRHASAWAEHSELWRALAIKERRPKQKEALLRRSVQAMQKAVVYKPNAHRFRYRLGILFLARRKPFLANVQFAVAHAKLPFHPCYKLGLSVSESMLMRKRATLYRDLKAGVLGCGHPLLSRVGRSMLVVVAMQHAQKLAERKQTGKAVSLMKEVTRLAPHVNKGFFYLALLQYQNNQCLQARKTLYALLKRAPKHKLAKKLLRHSKALRCGPLPSRRLFRKTYGGLQRRRAQPARRKTKPAPPQRRRPRPRSR